MDVSACVDCVFRLLERSTDPTPPNSQIVELGGIRWLLVGYQQIPTVAEAPEYVCISYSWGRGRTTNPVKAEQFVSDRALPAIEATINALQPGAIWIDALCVPFREPARAACLQQLGAIYAAAAEVAAVLSKGCAGVLEQIHNTGRLNSEALLSLETDDWVARAWTYQEIANSKVIQFVAEGGSGIAIDGYRMLNSLAYAIPDHKKTQGNEAAEYRSLHPRVDGLEDVLADYMISNYLHRFAYQVMSAMARRFSERPEDSLNAMVGAITSAATTGAVALLPPAERFMCVCEANGDYSFIYCIAPRSQVPGRHWRPMAGPNPAILSWHTFGVGQSAALHSTHLQLNNMCRMNSGPLNADARKLVLWWLNGGEISSPRDNLARAVLERLRRIGFSGSGEYLQLESGYFFPQSVSASIDEAEVVVAAGVRWGHGGPGLLVTRKIGDIHEFRDVGVFVGRVPKTGDPIGIG